MGKSSERTAQLLLGVVVFIWGANFIVMKAVFSEIPPLAFNAVRMTLAALALSAIWLAREGIPKMPWQDWLKLCGIGLLGNALYQVLFAIGLDLTTSGISSLLIGTIPIWSALLARTLGWEKITRRTWLGIFIAFVGITLVTLSGPSWEGTLAHNSLMGNGLTLLAALCWASYTVLSKRLLERYSALRVSAVGLLLGVWGLWPLAITDVLRLSWRSVSLPVWGSLFYSSCLSIALAYVIWSYSVQQLGAARTAIFNNIVPVVTFVLAFFVLREPITWLQIVGSAIVLTGVWQAAKKT